MQDDSRRATLEQGRDMAAQSMQRALKGDLDKLTERLASDRVQAALAAGDLAAAGTALGDGSKGVEEAARSEEHTSELQSLMRLSYAVLCLQQKTSYKTHLAIAYTPDTHRL